ENSPNKRQNRNKKIDFSMRILSIVMQVQVLFHKKRG
ncbi:MAG: hypothetical protein ACI80P_001918, partial [Flavobacteriales bacterium]